MPFSSIVYSRSRSALETNLSNDVTRIASPVVDPIAAARSELAGKVNMLTAADGEKFTAEVTSWNADVRR